MNKLILLFLLLLFASVTSTFNVVKADDIDMEVHRIMGWLDGAAPELDAEKALNNDEHRLWGVRGIVTYLPGIDREYYKVAAKRYGYRIIEGTTDGLKSDEHERYNDLAKQYAKKYNIYVQEHSNK
jgi:hypothetical protein